MNAAVSKCFILVLARREGGPQHKPLSLTTNTRSIDLYRLAARSAADQVAELYRTRRKELRFATVDVEGNTASAGTSPYSWQVLRSQVESDAWWVSVRGRLSRTLDVKQVGRRVREATVGVVTPSDSLLIVVNQELSPPPEWRYLLWDTSPTTVTSVISACQMDPYYWSGDVADRFAVLQTRLRVAMFSSVGEHLGLSRCDNDACYMRRDVFSVIELDEMRGCCAEHEQ
ncbi:MAG: hypothetical protein WKG01_26995 [Kofleriaceae bacterium]